MTTTKYIRNNGLGRFEEKEMAKLESYAKQGWHLEGFYGFKFKLRKGEPRNLKYSLDYQKHPDKEYFSFFEDAGWMHVCSADEIHIFCAPQNATPIYTDTISRIEMYEEEKKHMGKRAFPFLIASVLFFLFGILGNYLGINERINAFAIMLGGISALGLMFPGIVYYDLSLRLKNLRRNKYT